VKSPRSARSLIVSWLGRLGPLGPQANGQRAAVVWLLCASLLVVYSVVPDGEEPRAAETEPARRSTLTQADGEPRALSILEIAPGEPAAGSVITVSYDALDQETRPELRLNKQPLRVLASRTGSLLAQLPDDLPYGAVKLRLVQGDERSKPYELHIKPFNWQKLLRNACGGLALLMMGVGVLRRGVRGVLSVANAQRVAALTRSRWLLLAGGAVLGAGMQSTTAAAGLLAGAVGSRVLSVTAAASLFLGAQLGTALAPWLFGSITEPRSGLMAIAVGGLALILSLDRRGRSVAQLVLGAGLVAYGVQVLRPGFEPFASSPLLLAALDRIAPDGVLGAVVTVLLGTLLVALLQGPAPVLALALGIAQTTGHENLRTTLFMLSGTGLGAALGALLILPGGAQSRRLFALSLLAGLCNTLLALATIDGFAYVTSHWASLAPHTGLQWGKHTLPDVSWQIAVAFALSQLFAAWLLVPLLPRLERLSLAVRAFWRQRREPVSHAADPLAALRGSLLGVLAAQQRALPSMFELAATGARSSGVSAELALKQSYEALLALLSGHVATRTQGAAGATLARFALSSMQLQRALENALRTAEELTESRLAGSGSNNALVEDAAQLRPMHELLCEGLSQLSQQLRDGTTCDADDARGREIEMNRLEARTRGATLARFRSAAQLGESLPLLALSDAYEVAGNQLFRMAEVLEQRESSHAQDLGHIADDSDARGLLHARDL
jgi:Na+/phosphate symporter